MVQRGVCHTLGALVSPGCATRPNVRPARHFGRAGIALASTPLSGGIPNNTFRHTGRAGIQAYSDPLSPLSGGTPVARPPRGMRGRGTTAEGWEMASSTIPRARGLPVVGSVFDMARDTRALPHQQLYGARAGVRHAAAQPPLHRAGRNGGQPLPRAGGHEAPSLLRVLERLQRPGSAPRAPRSAPTGRSTRHFAAR